MRTGGRGKHNFLSGGAFRKAKYEKLRRRKKKRRKRGRAKIPSPPTPFLFARPSVQFWFCRPQGGNQSGFCSKWVRISSNKHHHIELVASLGASPLASAGRFASKLKGFLKSISSRPAARRRFEPIFFFRLWRKAKRDFIKLSVCVSFFNYN